MNKENTTKTITATIPKIFYSQSCLCCSNTRRLPEGMTYSSSPLVCDECKEAIDFLKFLKSHDQELIKLIMESK